MRISNLRPDFIRMDKMLHSSSVLHLPTSRQLLLLNLSSLTHLCLHLEQTKFSAIETYRLAFLALLQSTGVFRQIKKLHLTIHHSALLNLTPENFGPRLMKDGLAVGHLVITLMEQQGVKTMNTSEYSNGLQNFVSLVRSETFVLNIFHEPTNKKIMKILANDHIEQMKIIGPCQFQAQLQMSQLRELTISTSDHQCPLHMSGHKIGKCVLDRRVVAEGCPRLQEFSGVRMEKMIEIVAKQEELDLKKVKVKKRMRCWECEGCRRENCGKCRHCRDMKMFGGKGRFRQACQDRKCGGLEEEERECSIPELPGVRVQTWRNFVSCTV